MTYEYFEIAREGHRTIITIYRPEVHNALNVACHADLENVLDQFAADDEQWIAIITGVRPKAFCAGHDPGKKRHAKSHARAVVRSRGVSNSFCNPSSRGA